MLKQRQAEIRKAMQGDFDDEANLQRAFQHINEMRIQTADDPRTGTVRTLPDEVRQTDYSETLSSINEVMTPVIGHKYSKYPDVQEV